MIENLPTYIPIVFVITVVFTLIIFYWIIRNSNSEKVRNRSNLILVVALFWLTLQGFLSYNGIYSHGLNAIPPKMLLLGVLPNIFLIISLFFTQRGNRFIDSLSIEKYTYINVVRIPVEFVLLWLYLNKAIPQSMTFEGLNYDIIMGLTAPLIIYYGYKKKKLTTPIILVWHVIGIVLLMSVVVIGLFSAPFPIQKLAFDQPNIGLLYFPFSWLPTFIVPIVILGHLISIRQIIKKKSGKNAI